MINEERGKRKSLLAAGVVVAFTLMQCGQVYAQNFGQKHDFHIDERTLGLALDAIVQQTSLVILYPHEFSEHTGVNSVVGTFSVPEALDELLKGTRFTGGLTESGTMFVSLSDDIDKMGNLEEKVSTNLIKKGLFASAAAFLFGMPDGAVAQEESGASRQLDRIVVTARKRAEDASDVPMSITAIGGDTLQQDNLSDIASLSESLPGFSSGEAFNSSDRFSVRGISTNGTNSGFEQTVGFNVDGYYFNRSRFGQTMFLDLERVEVLKGPQNTLIGKNNTAGALNIVTRKPGDEFGGYAVTTYDFEDTEGVSVEGALNVPVSDAFRVRLSGRIEDRDGYVTDAITGIDDFGSRESWTLRGIAQWDISDAFDATAMVQYGDIDRGGRARELAGSCSDSPPIDDCIINGVKYQAPEWGGELVDEFTQTQYFIAGLTLNYEVSDNWTISSLTNYTEYEGDNLSVADF